jgi:dTDP-4-amino-4,6-dideoxygalactose transaminase
LAGYPADIERIADICQKHSLKLIEDCDNALFATVKAKKVGLFGDFGIYSFYPNRQINATEGGALACKRREDADRAIRLRRYGIDLPKFRDRLGEIDANCDIPEIGWAASLNNLCSAIGLAQLDSAEDRIEGARRVAERYVAALEGVPGITIVKPRSGAVPAYWAFLIQLEHRDAVLASMKRLGVHVSKLHHRTDAYSGFGVPPATLPMTERFLGSVLGLPCGWWLGDDDVERVIEALKRSVSEVPV